jgi:hypothetical protein
VVRHNATAQTAKAAATSGSHVAGRRSTLSTRVRDLVRAINDGDDAMVEQAVLDLSRRRRWLAPLAFAVGAVVMLFQGVRLLVSNWRLTLVMLLPAAWIWIGMYDLKLHLLRGHTYRDIRGPILIPLFLIIMALTAASFYLNAVFGFAISQRGRPQVRPAFRQARGHAAPIWAFGALVGLGLAFATLITPRWGHWWFAISLSIVLAVMTFAYVALPARLLGGKRPRALRDKVSAGIIGGALGAVVCGPPHLISRLAILMLGSRWLFIPGIILLTFGVTLQAGATGAVKALKMSTKLLVGQEGPAPVPTQGP